MINSEIIYLLQHVSCYYAIVCELQFLIYFKEDRLDFLYGNRAEHLLSMSRSVLAYNLLCPLERDYTKSNL